jgi:hypothetical protein
MREHLKTRFFNPDLYSSITVTDTELTVLLWNLTGQAVGYQVYNPAKPKKAKERSEMKYFTHVTAGQNAVWGLETLEWNSPFVFVTEGIFDACRLHYHGFPAIAVLSNNPTHLNSWFSSLPQITIAAVQGDKAGQVLASITDRAIYLPKNEDVGSITEEDFDSMFRNFIK